MVVRSQVIKGSAGGADSERIAKSALGWTELANICYPVRSILKKEAEWKWTQEHEKALLRVTNELKRVAELPHVKRNAELKIICDASKEGFVAVLQQLEEKAWRPLASPQDF